MQRIADYPTVRFLGEGSNGPVWLCQTPARLGAGQSHAAVKLLTDSASQAAFRAVAEELKLVSVVASRHVVRLFEVGYWDARVYVAMEHLAGPTLRAGAGSDPHAGARAVAAAARGAHALHERGVAHRALKPANIFVADADADAGGPGAKIAEPGVSHLLTSRKTLSGVGAVETLEFMEQGVAHGEPACRASDIWSLGACLQYALTGESLYGPDLPRDSLLATVRHVFTASVEPSATLDEPWREIVGHCVASDRADRYPTAEALADDIDRVHDQVRQS